MESNQPQTDGQGNSDWDDFVNNFQIFWGMYGNQILAVVCVASLVFAAWSFYSNNQRSNKERQHGELAAASSPEALRAVGADFSGNASVSSRAFRKAGDLYLQEALNLTLSDDERAAARDKAGESYQSALDAAEQPVFQANAMLGLAAVAEDRLNIDEARRLYTDAQALAAEHHLPAQAAAAQARLAFLDELSTPVTFAPEPEALPEPTPEDSGPDPIDGPIDGPVDDPAQPAEQPDTNTEPSEPTGADASANSAESEPSEGPDPDAPETTGTPPADTTPDTADEPGEASGPEVPAADTPEPAPADAGE